MDKAAVPRIWKKLYMLFEAADIASLIPRFLESTVRVTKLQLLADFVKGMLAARLQS